MMFGNTTKDNVNDWSFPDNDEQLFVELMVSDVSTSLISPQEEKSSKTNSTRVEKKQKKNGKSSNTSKPTQDKKRKRSSTSEPSKKKQKGAKTVEATTRECRQSLTTKGFKRHFAKHDYHDYARVKPNQFEIDSIKASRGGVHNPFPAVLHGMMEQAEEKKFSHIVSWQSHGRAFLIRDPKAFVAKVLPLYFKHSKLSSFQRQLSLYGFIRLTHDGADRGAYYHECFLRGRPFLCSKIQRTRVKGTWVRTSSSPESEPDFCSMEPVVDLDKLDTTQSTTATAVPTDRSRSVSISSSSSSSSEDEEESCNGSSSSEDEEEIRAPLVTSSSVKFLDMLDSITSDDYKILVDEPPADAGLQPPPTFPTFVVGTNNPETPSTKALQTTSYLPPKLPSIEITSLANSMMLGTTAARPTQSFPSTAPFDDHELAQFLTDVDLDTDFDTEDVIQLVTV